MNTLVNVSTRPVELHLEAGVTVLQPAERLDCDDVTAGQIAALVRRGVLHVLPEQPATEDEKEEEKAEEKPEKPRRTRRAGGKPAESS